MATASISRCMRAQYLSPLPSAALPNVNLADLHAPQAHTVVIPKPCRPQKNCLRRPFRATFLTSTGSPIRTCCFAQVAQLTVIRIIILARQWTSGPGCGPVRHINPTTTCDGIQACSLPQHMCFCLSLSANSLEIYFFMQITFEQE